MKVWVAGEALIDLVPSGDLMEPSVLPIVGGGPANTAKALAKLGISTCFIGGISNDTYGLSIQAELSDVDLGLSLRSELPTALAIVSLDERGSATYEFKLEGSATFDFSRDWLPNSAPEVLYLGTLATVIEPGASELFEWASGLGAPIIYDPNVRPSVLGDRDEYRKKVLTWASIAKVVKLSEEDLNWLGFPNPSIFLEMGVKLVVLTKGEKGLSGFTNSLVVDVPGVSVKVVDTVGAGDTVGAVIVEGVANFGLEEMLEKRLEYVLNRAARAASITCSRSGANPPSAEELN